MSGPGGAPPSGRPGPAGGGRTYPLDPRLTCRVVREGGEKSPSDGPRPRPEFLCPLVRPKPRPQGAARGLLGRRSRPSTGSGPSGPQALDKRRESDPCRGSARKGRGCPVVSPRAPAIPGPEDAFAKWPRSSPLFRAWVLWFLPGSSCLGGAGRVVKWVGFRVRRPEPPLSDGQPPILWSGPLEGLKASRQTPLASTARVMRFGGSRSLRARVRVRYSSELLGQSARLRRPIIGSRTPWVQWRRGDPASC